MRTDLSRIGQLPSVADTFPAGLMADEILTPGEGQVRALFCVSGNPLLTVPNSNGRLEAAMKALELLVVIDIFRNETANHMRTTFCRARARSSARTCPLCFSR